MLVDVSSVFFFYTGESEWCGCCLFDGPDVDVDHEAAEDFEPCVETSIGGWRNGRLGGNA